MNRITSYGPGPLDLPRLSFLSPGTDAEALRRVEKMAQEAKDRNEDERYVLELDGSDLLEIERDQVLSLIVLKRKFNAQRS